MPVSVTSSGIGGPISAIGVGDGELANLGVKVIIRIRSCGGYGRETSIDDLIIPFGVVRGNGTSKFYVWHLIHRFLTPNCLRGFSAVGLRAKREISHSLVLGHYRSNEKSKGFLSSWTQFRAFGADMTAVTLFVVGRLRGLQIGTAVPVMFNCAQAMEPWQGLTDYTTKAVVHCKGPRYQGKIRLSWWPLKLIARLG